MSKSVLYMSMSLDGFIAGPNDAVGNPGGDDFMRLHDWYGFESEPPHADGTGWGAHFLAEGRTAGAVLIGRRTAEQIDHWAATCMTVCRSSWSAIARPALLRWPTILG